MERKRSTSFNLKDVPFSKKKKRKCEESSNDCSLDEKEDTHQIDLNGTVVNLNSIYY